MGMLLAIFGVYWLGTVAGTDAAVGAGIQTTGFTKKVLVVKETCSDLDHVVMESGPEAMDALLAHSFATLQDTDMLYVLDDSEIFTLSLEDLQNEITTVHVPRQHLSSTIAQAVQEMERQHEEPSCPVVALNVVCGPESDPTCALSLISKGPVREPIAYSRPCPVSIDLTPR